MRVLFDVLRDGLPSLEKSLSQMSEAQHELSSGRRLRSVSTDPLAARQAIGEHTTLGALDTFTRTAHTAAARLATADNVLEGYIDKLSALIVTGTAGRGTAVDPTARTALAADVRALSAALLGDINTKADGVYLFSGTQSNTPAYANVGGTWTYQGDNATARVEVQTGVQAQTTFDGQAIAQGSASTDVFSAAERLAVAIETADDVTVGLALDDLDQAFDRALRAQGAIGAEQRLVTDSTLRLDDLRRAAETRRSHLEDANIAEAITRLSRSETAYEGALGAVSRSERLTLLDYLR